MPGMRDDQRRTAAMFLLAHDLTQMVRMQPNFRGRRQATVLLRGRVGKSRWEKSGARAHGAPPRADHQDGAGYSTAQPFVEQSNYSGMRAGLYRRSRSLSSARNRRRHSSFRASRWT